MTFIWHAFVSSSPNHYRWGGSNPLFFCSGTEIARDVAEDFAADPKGSLSAHPLEKLMLLPSKWLEENMLAACNKYLHVMEVYVNNFCTMVQTPDVEHLRHISHSLLHVIHSVFFPPEVLGLEGGDPISYKKY